MKDAAWVALILAVAALVGWYGTIVAAPRPAHPSVVIRIER